MINTTLNIKDVIKLHSIFIKTLLHFEFQYTLYCLMACLFNTICAFLLSPHSFLTCFWNKAISTTLFKASTPARFSPSLCLLPVHQLAYPSSEFLAWSALQFLLHECHKSRL